MDLGIQVDPPAAPAANGVPWVLGTHLNTAVGPLSRAEPGDRVLMIEAHEFAERLPYHESKLVLLFSAMRHFRDELDRAGYEVVYEQVPTFADGLANYGEQFPADTLALMEPPAHGAGARFSALASEAGVDLDLVPDERFLSSPRAFDRWRGDRDPPFRHEDFYRFLRRETGVLMDGEDPVGGAWNYDEKNRDTPPADWEPPPRHRVEPDAVTRETQDWVQERFDTWGTSEGFDWPVTRAGARDRLEQFLTHRLPAFGTYQDAMRADSWAMAHSLLAPAMNLGLLHPWRVVRAAESQLDREAVGLNAVEGFVRQVLGWREFMRHTYRVGMPDLAEANQLGAEGDLPEYYWTGETDMACVADAVRTVREQGYAHHIPRLMVLANVATLLGTEPAALNRWFQSTFVDAAHWVTTPNVIEMGSYGAGLFATKPYVASANYLDRMGDFCGDCQFDPGTVTGEAGCPVSALYWDFLARNESQLRENHRMGLVYSHLDDKRDAGRLAAIRDRAATFRRAAGFESPEN